MIYSQTGFGCAEVNDDDLRFEVEIRSVNNRFLDINIRLPRSLYAYENDFRKRVKAKLERGKVLVHIAEAKDNLRKAMFKFDDDAVKSLVERIRNAGKAAGLRDDLGLSDLISISEWLEPVEGELLAEKRRALALDGLDKALDAFVNMSMKEGENLASDLGDRVHLISKRVEDISLKSDENRLTLLEQLKERIERYISNNSIEDNRLEHEVAILVDKLDITEEVVRMRSHNQLFLESLKKGGAVGKRLNFIIQEMGREVNTMGSKAAAPEITAWVVEIKEELEKMREQVQNVV
ncbi:MAG: YicC/YloC family endoribonuclease [Candidatus Electryonea clarkiae]|nr:YicC/YloC family endoribonuclease [Candidatus Electryonea clarkiae]MDP8287125.1 YicC/YloC family endoribonuclease [Candidatus Electryonea clarkiae]